MTTTMDVGTLREELPVLQQIADVLRRSPSTIRRIARITK